MEYVQLLIEQRKAKIEAIRALGVDPYPYRFDPANTTREIVADPERFSEQPVSIAGRLMSIRGKGKTAFAHIQDAEGRIQIYVRRDAVGETPYSIWNLLDIGDIIGVKGPVFVTHTGETTVQVTEFVVLCKSIRPLPVVKEQMVEGERRVYDDIRSNVELRYRHRSIDLIINPEVREVFRKRSQILQSVRRVLEDRGFIEVETPALQRVYGGANARPFKTHHNALDIDLYLKISPELYLKRLVVGGLERVYDLSKNFRNEGIDRTHNPEFTMLEAYQAYADFNDMMALTEAVYVESCLKVNGTTTISLQGREINLEPPWERVEMVEAIGKHAGISVENLSDEELLSMVRVHDPDAPAVLSRGMLIADLFEYRVEKELTGPVFVTNHPEETSPLCKASRTRPGFIERFEPYILGYEIGNAYSEMNDPVRQRQLLEAQAAHREVDGEVPPVDEDFLRAMEIGMPPTGGLGIGIDRMVMVLTDQASIRDVIAFPTLRPADARDADTP
ncbi:MAG TPA: lysine--tRNA ligase [Candidatus Latescibacteria bacterium]|nr:lysine--tRNA ligase [Candidatus Latescibacterota bacterium]HRS96110.1 lysine--tRNA ligase [Candidatus Latescibacterota bacterium]